MSEKISTEVLTELCEDLFIKNVVYLDEVDSTNLFAKQNLEQNPVEHPTLIVAENQTSGRGRGSNTWWANEGALTFSIRFQPGQFNIPKEIWPLISLAAANSVSKAVESIPNLDLECQLKWPNDVYLQDKKLAGILLEIPPNQQSTVIVGIGININNSLLDAPNTIQKIGISVIDILKESINRMEVLRQLLYHFESEIEELSETSDFLVSYWKQRCWLTQRTVTILNGSDSVSGTCQGIDDDGGIQLITENGLQKFHGGIIQLVE